MSLVLKSFVEALRAHNLLGLTIQFSYCPYQIQPNDLEMPNLHNSSKFQTSRIQDINIIE